jgi:hypothetical protein
METEFFAACREYKCLCATCGCEHHCGHSCQECETCPDCTCTHCEHAEIGN